LGYYLQIDEDDPAPLASLTGWGDVIRWADGLPAQRASAIKHLCQFGWQEQVTLLKIELEECFRSDPPRDAQTRDTLKNFIALLAARKEGSIVASVTDGLGPE